MLFEATVRFDTDETLTWGFDIGDEGLSNDLCMIWEKAD